MTDSASRPHRIDEADWVERVARHEQRVDAWIQPRLARRRRGQAHPVDDFLFDYYYVRPARLRSWHPGHGWVLGGAAEAWLAHPAYARLEGGVGTTVASLRPRLAQAHEVLRVLRGTTSRPGAFACFALHEWAMVYALRPEEVRHSAWPLRLSPPEVAATVSDLGLRCTHVDAYRFFTPAAAPLNSHRPTRASQADLEQSGCLHATMDLYKWAAKLSPHLGSDLVVDCFALAREARDLDMRAAPYDLTALGVTPIPIETAEGRAAFATAQRALAQRGDQLRDRLIAAVAELLQAAGPPAAGPGDESAPGVRPPAGPGSRSSTRPGDYSSSTSSSSSPSSSSSSSTRTATPSSASTLPSAS